MAAVDEEVKKACENCKQLFPESKVQLHEAYCLRNIRKCPNCEMFVDKREMEEHQEEFHKPVQCEKCGKTVENQTLMQKHIDTQCQLRPRECRYCNVSFPVQEFEQHEYTCGCRTKQCELCKKNILMRDYDIHIDTCVGIVEEIKKPEIKPKASVPQSNNQSSQSNQQNKPASQNIPSSYPQSSINQILKNERVRELNNGDFDPNAALKKKKEEDDQRAAAAAQQMKNQYQKDSLNKGTNVPPYQPSSQYQQQNVSNPSQPSKTNISSQQQQRNPISTNNQALNNLEKNKIPNDQIKPQISSVNGLSKQQSSNSSQGQQNVQLNPTRPTQQQEKQLVDKYGIKPPSSQGQRQPLVANKQDIPSVSKPNQISAQNQQQPISTYQMRQDDIYGGGLGNKYDKDPYSQKREDLKPNNNIYNSKQSSNVSDASRQRREEERLKELNDLPTQGYYDNLKTMKNPNFEKKSSELSSQDKYQQKYTNMNQINKQPLTNEQKPKTQNIYPDQQQKPINNYQYPQPIQNQQQIKPQQQTNEKPSYGSQATNYQPSVPIQKQIPPKGQPEFNQPSSKYPPTGYKNHEEILRNVPSQASQGISGIPNYQPLNKPTGYPSNTQSTSNQNQRVPSRGKYDQKPTYPPSSQQNPVLKKQPSSSGNNKQDNIGYDDDDELQKAIMMSVQEKSKQPQLNSRSSQPKPSNQQIKQNPSYEQKPKYNDGGVNNEDEEEIQRAIMESMKQAKQQPTSNKYGKEKQGGGYKPQQQYNKQYGGMADDEVYDEEMEKAILQSLKK